MIVADANLLVYLLVPSGQLTRRAEYVRSREKVWIAPPLLRSELLNVLSGHVRRGDMDVDKAAKTYRRGLAMTEISLALPEPLSILRSADQTGCSTYDVEYVSLAIELGLRLVTADQQVLRAYPNVAVSMETFA